MSNENKRSWGRILRRVLVVVVMMSVTLTLFWFLLREQGIERWSQRTARVAAALRDGRLGRGVEIGPVLRIDSKASVFVKIKTTHHGECRAYAYRGREQFVTLYVDEEGRMLGGTIVSNVDFNGMVQWYSVDPEAMLDIMMQSGEER